jgi:Trk K+ transport system NAD-binding subunit
MSIARQGPQILPKHIFVIHADMQTKTTTSAKNEKHKPRYVAKKLEESIWSNADIQIIISPEKLTRQTIYPYISTKHTVKKRLQEINTKLTAIQKNYESLVQEKRNRTIISKTKKIQSISLLLMD